MTPVGDAIMKSMKEHKCFSVGWGDGWILDNAGDLVKVKIDHPLNRMRAIFQHLERDERFEKKYRKSMRSDGKEARVRVFRLKDDFQ